MPRRLRAAFIITGAAAVLAVGVLIAPVPGPGFTILAPIGLAMLAGEIAWVRRFRDRLLQGDRAPIRRVDRLLTGWRGWAFLVLTLAYWPAVLLVWGGTPDPWLYLVLGSAFAPLCAMAMRWLQLRLTAFRARRSRGRAS